MNSSADTIPKRSCKGYEVMTTLVALIVSDFLVLGTASLGTYSKPMPVSLIGERFGTPFYVPVQI